MGDLAVLASGVVAAVAPYVVEAGKKAAGKAGEAAFAQAAKLWDVVKARLADRGQGTALETFQRDPADPDRQGGLRVALRDLLEKDPALADEFAKLLAAAPESGRPGVTQTATVIGHRNRVTQIVGGNSTKARA